MKKPNILFIMTDQQRYDSLGCYGCNIAPTPNLDRLGAEGAIFDNSVVSNTICTPSRASVFTGQPLPNHGVYKLYDCLDYDQIMFPELLQQAGYRTALFGKLHVSSFHLEAIERHPHDGFDVYEWCHESPMKMDSEFNAYSKWLFEKNPAFHQQLKEQGRKLAPIPNEYHFTHWAAERTIDYIRNAGDQPWFAYMSVFDPHDPYDSTEQKYMDMIDPDNIPKRVTGDNEPDCKPEATRRSSALFSDITDDKIKEMRHGYYASIAQIDEEVGRVLDALEETGQAENTLVIFTSDHGDMLGDHGLFYKGQFFYDPCVKVPLLTRWPGVIKSGTRVAEPVVNYDITATILTAAGYPEDEIKKIMPDAVDLTASNKRGYAICCYRNTGLHHGGGYWDPEINATMIRTEEYKLTVYHNTDEGELYDMKNDPLEFNNLWDNPVYSNIQIKLMKELIDWLFAREQPTETSHLPV